MVAPCYFHSSTILNCFQGRTLEKGIFIFYVLILLKEVRRLAFPANLWKPQFFWQK